MQNGYLKRLPSSWQIEKTCKVYIGMSVYLARFLFDRGVADKDVPYKVMSIEEIPTSQRESPCTTHWVYFAEVSFRVTNAMVRVPYRPRSTGARE